MSDTITEVSAEARAFLRTLTYDQLRDEMLDARLNQQAHERCGRIQSCHLLAEAAVNALVEELAHRHAWKGPKT